VEEEQRLPLTVRFVLEFGTVGGLGRLHARSRPGAVGLSRSLDGEALEVGRPALLEPAVVDGDREIVTEDAFAVPDRSVPEFGRRERPSG
jgi:hypothetical protein